MGHGDVFDALMAFTADRQIVLLSSGACQHRCPVTAGMDRSRKLLFSAERACAGIDLLSKSDTTGPPLRVRLHFERTRMYR